MKKKNINNKLIEIREHYIKGNNIDTIKIYSKISVKNLFLFIVSILHYLAMTEVEGILFSVLAEIKK